MNDTTVSKLPLNYLYGCIHGWEAYKTRCFPNHFPFDLTVTGTTSIPFPLVQRAKEQKQRPAASECVR